MYLNWQLLRENDVNRDCVIDRDELKNAMEMVKYEDVIIYQ